MAPESRPDPVPSENWLSRLLQKRVFQTLAIYVAIAWGGTEIILAVQETFGLPDWLSRSVMALFIAGAPVAVFLAWVRDLQSTGSRVLLTLLATAVFLTGAWLVYIGGGQPGPPESSVVILPFEDLGESGDREWLARAISEDLRNRLAQSGELLVIASGSSESFSDQPHHLDGIRTRLRVRHVLDGNIRPIAHGLRINVNLWDTVTGETRWSDRFEFPERDLLDIEDRIVDRIAGILEVTLSEKLLPGSTRNIDAWIAFQRGYEGMEPVARRQNFEEAVSLDQRFALPMIYLAADYFGDLEQQILDYDSAWALASPWLALAAEVSNDIPEYHLVSGWFSTQAQDWEKAEQHYQRAIALNPNFALAYGSYGLLMRWALEKPDEALQMHRKNVQIDPLDCTANLQFGTSLWIAGHFEEAADQYEFTIELCPENQLVYESYSAMYAAKLGRADKALEVVYRGFSSITEPLTPRLLSTAAHWHQMLSDHQSVAYYLRALELEFPGSPATQQLRETIASDGADTMNTMEESNRIEQQRLVGEKLSSGEFRYPLIVLKHIPND